MARRDNRAIGMVTRRRFIKTGLIFVPFYISDVRGQLATLPCRRKAFGTASTDPDLTDWVNRVQGQGSDVTGAGVQTAVGAFITGLKTDSVWTLGYRIGVYAGDGILALNAPLKNTVGGTTDVLTGFVAGDYTSNGMIGGTGKYINTAVAISGVGGTPDIVNISMGVYNRSASAATSIEMGCATNLDSSRQHRILISAAGVSYFGMGSTASNQISAVDVNGVGFYLGVRSSSTVMKLYKAGVELATTSGASGATVSAFPIWVHAVDNSLSPGFESSRQLSIYWIGAALDATQQGNLATRVQTLQTALGRQV
jgi:hypothetical protein